MNTNMTGFSDPRALEESSLSMGRVNLMGFGVGGVHVYVMVGNNVVITVPTAKHKTSID